MNAPLSDILWITAQGGYVNRSNEEEGDRTLVWLFPVPMKTEHQTYFGVTSIEYLQSKYAFLLAHTKKALSLS